MHARNKAASAVVLALLTLVACGGGGASPQATLTPAQAGITAIPTTPPVTAAPSPAPTVLTTAEAGATYLRIVKLPNRALTRLNKYVKRHANESLAQQNLATLKRLSKTWADRNREFSIALLQQAWPSDVKPAIRQLIRELTREQTFIRDMAEAHSALDFSQAWNAIPADKGAAELIRQQLGLPERT